MLEDFPIVTKKLSPSDSRKHVAIQNQLGKAILTISGMVHEGRATKEQAAWKLEEIGKEILRRYGYKRAIRAWEDLLFNRLIRIKNQRSGAVMLFYEPLSLYFHRLGAKITYPAISIVVPVETGEEDGKHDQDQ